MIGKLLHFLIKRTVVTAIAIISCGIAVLLVYHQYLVRERQVQRIASKKIDSLLSWTNDVYAQSPDKAFAILDMAKSMAIETANPEIIGNVLNKEALFLGYIENYPKSILGFKQAAKLFEKSNQLNKLADAYSEIAYNSKIIGEYIQSLEYCNKSLEIYQKLNDKRGLKFCYRIMGSDYKYLDDYEKAIVYYKKSLSICQEIGNEDDISEALINLSTGYSAKGNDSLANELMQQSFIICKKRNDIGGLSVCYINIGSHLVDKRQFERGIEYLRLGLKYSRQIGYKQTESSALFDIGSYFDKVNRSDSAVHYYNQSLSIATKYSLRSKILLCYEALSKTFIKSGNPYEAYQQLIKYNQIRDTILDAKKSQEISKIEANFDRYKEQLQVSTEKQKRKLLSIIFVLSILVFSLGFILLVKRYKRFLHKQQEYNQTLIEEKSKIEENLSEKDKELITYSLQLAQKQEIENALADRIRREIETSSSEAKKTLQSILNNIVVESQRVNIWNDFEVRFNQVNQHFYKNLLEKHPALSKNERRLCAFMKLNLSTKEITIITGQSPHSINVARTRLRRKLNLVNNNQNLPDYLQNF